MFKLKSLVDFFMPRLSVDMGGGGQSQPSSTTQTVELPAWARPYAQETLAKGKALTESAAAPTYGGQRYAGLSELQKSAIGSVGTPETYNKSIQGFMSPYAQNVIDIQKREAGRQSGIMGTQQKAQATQAGAFGGYRQGIQEAERERNLTQQMGDIQQRGSEAAYQNAQQALQRDIANKMQLGAMQQADIQRPLDIAYQDYLNQQNYPYKQLGFMSDLIRGTPTGSSSAMSMYQAPGSLTGQLAGLGMGAYGLSRAFAKEGGLMDSEGYAAGGVTDDRNVQGILSKLSDQQLTDARFAALNDRDNARLQMIDAEMAERASMRHGLASIPVDFAAFAPDEENYATGGIVAFAGPTDENNQSLVTDPMGTGASEISQVAGPPGRSFLEALTNEPAWKSELRREQEEKARKAKATPSKVEPDAKDKKIMAQFEADQKASSSAPAPSASVSAPKAPARSISDAARIVTDVVKTQVPKDDVGKIYEDIAKKLNDAPRPESEALTRMLEKAEKRAEEIKSRGVAEALMKFGFGMAASAAKPGQARRSGLAGALESAAAASPILAESLAENQKLQAAAEDNALKLRMEQARYQSAMEQGNRQLAASLAGSISQRNLQQSALEEQINQNARANALKEKEIAGIAAYRAQAGEPALVRIAERFMSENPKLTFEQAMDKASRSAGYSFRSEGAMGGRLAAELEKIEKDFKMLPALMAGNPNSPFVQNMQADLKRRRDEVYRLYGAERPGGVTSDQSPAAGAGQMKLLGVR